MMDLLGSDLPVESDEGMKFVNSQLCNKMGYQWLNDRLVTFIERDILETINNYVILAHFQKMGNRRFSL